MRLQSIRLKMILPIALLALVLLALLIFMLVITKVQDDAMERQSETYFEAVAVVLNADRDIYQARIALENIIAGNGDKEKYRQDFYDNAKQVDQRFKQYLAYLADEPELLQKHDNFSSFEPLYKAWFDASEKLLQADNIGQNLLRDFNEVEPQFLKIREMMDQAGEQLREHSRNKKNASTRAADLEKYVEGIAEILNADRDIYQARLAKQKIANGTGNLEENRRYFEENAAQVLQRFHNYRSYLISEPALTEPYTDFDLMHSEWYERSKQLVYSNGAKTLSDIPSELAIAEKKFEAIRNVLDVAGEAARTQARSIKEDLLNEVDRYENIAVVVIVIAFALALFTGYYVPLKITHDVENITARIKEIAAGDGDLTQRINAVSKDELGDLASEFNDFLDHLRTIITNIQKQSALLGGVTDGLNQVAQQAGQITNKLAMASNSIVSSGSEMDVSNQQMASLAQDTAQDAESSTALAQKGVAAVDSSNLAIKNLASDIGSALQHAIELESSSSDITSVLEVIRNIADQTNLLALNAAIEAARAGEQGRGFAVVADEVRTLATRTQDSTNEIEAMIQRLNDNVKASSTVIKNSQSNADNTLNDFDEVINIFHQLSDSFRKVREMSAQTAQATNEQSGVAQEINRNLVSLKEQSDNMQQMSAQVTEQANRIASLYLSMKQQVDSFKV
ncbi:methyl-accepting chemotaxis protein [Neptunicella marina]|uniref:Methyl-accepting chemotaxis protein n=1 Tax=Neptunicella marina TaxID=2125989 RepID=A0A8J6IU21_9ALTE|nr:methyl-accepting chemotaxis protein [Neptunicella marina]MBC3765626.1 methyl-accepting chemotaxis protein [Neptunicella marina]